MEALEVRFTLATPMRALEQPLHLDALLAWAAVEEAGGEYRAQESLPLERFETATPDRWVWKASRVVPHVVARDSLHRIRRFEPMTWAMDKGVVFEGGPDVVTSGTGPNKAYQLVDPIAVADRATAWAIGDRNAVEALLARITHLGKLRRLDLGRIGTIDVSPDPRPHLERWKLRTMPVATSGYYRARMTLHAPYWDRTNLADAWEPSGEALRAAM